MICCGDFRCKSEFPVWLPGSARRYAPPRLSILTARLSRCIPTLWRLRPGEIVVRDASGAVVDRFASPAKTDPVQWDGVGSNGVVVPDGVYSFAFENLSECKVLGENPVETYNTVTEVQSFGGQTSLVAHRGIVIRVGYVTALRSPS